MEITSTKIYFFIVIFFISVFSTLITIPYIKQYAIKKNLLDYPDIRKQRSSNAVRLGGLALISSFLLSLFFLIVFSSFFGIDAIFTENIKILGLCSIFYFLLGFFDDLYNLKPLPKLIFQFIFGFFLWSKGINIQNINLPFVENQEIYLPDTLSIIFTICWISAITNSINWIDGLDGLAIGISGLCFVPISILNFQNGNYDIALSSICIIGACIGFLRYNFKPSRILMGDGGSYFLGMNIASMSIMASSSYQINQSIKIASVDIICSLLIVALPLFDLIRVIIIRISKGLSPFYPDREHIHHKFVDRGIKEEYAVIIIYIISVITGSLALFYKGINLTLIISTFSILIFIYRGILIKREN